MPRVRILQRCLLGLLAIAGSSWATVDLQIHPNPAWEGEVAELRLVSNTAHAKLPRLPEINGIEWVAGPHIAQSFHIINGRRSAVFTTTYQFRAAKADNYTLPALTINIDGRQIRSVAQQFNVRKRSFADSSGNHLTLEDLVFAEATVGGRRAGNEQLFIGESVDLLIRVFIPDQFYHSLSYPEIELGNVTFHDFSELYPPNQRNRQSPKFKPPQIVAQQHNNMPFRVISFTTRVTPLATGTVHGHAQIQCQLRMPSQQQDQMFNRGVIDSFFARQQAMVAHTLAVKLPPLTVRALPAPPADGSINLNLVGQWQLEFKLDSAQVDAGDLLSAELKVHGQGNIQALTVPKLPVTQFRQYDPEIKVVATGSSGGAAAAVITWALVPLQAGATLPELCFSVFDPEQGRYRQHRFKPQIKVNPAAAGLAHSSNGSMAGAQHQLPPESETAPVISDIRDVSTSLSSAVQLPLWRHRAGSVAVLLLLAALITGGTLVLSLQRRRHGDVDLRRRSTTARQRNQLFRDLRHAAAEQRPALIREQLVPLLNSCLELPPGTTTSELAQRLEPQQPELATMLRQAEADSFIPGSAASLDVNSLLQHVQRLAVLFACLLFAPMADAAAVAVERRAPADLEQATAAYDQGDIELAAGIYQQLLDQHGPSATLLYNLGNCAYRQGQRGRAIAYYEQARRLAPRQGEIVDNLNFVRASLGLAPRYRVEHPRDLLSFVRDYLRPDEWLLGIAALILLWSIGFALCTWQRRRQPRRWLHLTAAVLLLVSATALITQLRGPYRPNAQAVIVRDQARVHVLPNSEAATAAIDLPEGSFGAIVGSRSDWLRIRVGNGEGWIERRAAMPVW